MSKLISIIHYDGTNIFSKTLDKSSNNYHYCSNDDIDTCDLATKGRCSLECKYYSKVSKQGPTKRAKSYHTFRERVSEEDRASFLTLEHSRLGSVVNGEIRVPEGEYHKEVWIKLEELTPDKVHDMLTSSKEYIMSGYREYYLFQQEPLFVHKLKTRFPEHFEYADKKENGKLSQLYDKNVSRLKEQYMADSCFPVGAINSRYGVKQGDGSWSRERHFHTYTQTQITRFKGTEYLKVENIDYISDDAKFKGDV